MLCDHLEGWDREGGREGDTRGRGYGDICICITVLVIGLPPPLLSLVGALMAVGIFLGVPGCLTKIRPQTSPTFTSHPLNLLLFVRF